MELLSYAEKHYRSATERSFEAALHRFLKENIPQLGPELIGALGTGLIKLFDKYMYTKDRIKPGQMMWVAVSKDTRSDSKRVKYVPIVLTLVEDSDINDLIHGKSNGKPNKLLPQTIARLCKEAYDQGALLSMRDIALILKRNSPDVSAKRKAYEELSGEILPTPATLQDMGSGITHKGIIIEKVLIEKKDMALVRSETHHTQNAIDKYLKEYYRVEMLLNDNKSIDYISKVINMRPFLIKQYKKIYQEVKIN